MALEQVNYSQAVTFEPEGQYWSVIISSGGKAPSGQAQSQYGAFSGYDFFVAPTNNTFVPVSPAFTGDKFRLYNAGGALKESTVFTVIGTLPVTGTQNYYVFFTPAPAVAPVSTDTAQAVPAPKKARWLGSLGHVTNMTRSYTCPGGPDSLSLLLRMPPEKRTDAINPGRVIQVYRGASCIWEGKLNEPAPSADGWQVTAHGAGTYGEDFAALYTTWNADDAVNQAIFRGMRWENPGIGKPAGIFLSQVQDSASQTITAHMNLLITGGGLLWMVSPGTASSPPAGAWKLRVFPFKQDFNGNPTQAPDRILLSNTPIARTVAADVNVLWLRYQATADVAATSTKKAVPATFAIAHCVNGDSVARHGPMEYYLDITSAGVLKLAQAQAIGFNILTRYVRASFAGPFTVGPGQVLNTAGTPVDLGADQAGLVYQVVVADPSYGGEVLPGPVIFMSGQYEYDEDTGQATITPFQSYRSDIASLISTLYPQRF